MSSRHVRDYGAAWAIERNAEVADLGIGEGAGEQGQAENPASQHSSEHPCGLRWEYVAMRETKVEREGKKHGRSTP